MAKNDGGKAFPIAGNTGVQHYGMSLRDWFAGQALATLKGYPFADQSYAAKEAYRLADAMLAERDR